MQVQSTCKAVQIRKGSGPSQLKFHFHMAHALKESQLALNMWKGGVQTFTICLAIPTNIEHILHATEKANGRIESAIV